MPNDRSDAWPPLVLRVAQDEIQHLKDTVVSQCQLHGLDPESPLPPAAHVAPRFRRQAQERKEGRRHTQRP